MFCYTTLRNSFENLKNYHHASTPTIIINLFCVKINKTYQHLDEIRHKKMPRQ